MSYDPKKVEPGICGCGVLDVDEDSVCDNIDQCPETNCGEAVNQDGCSINQMCPCDETWKNHGAYVSCVTHVAEDFLDTGLITEKEKDIIVSQAARSECGHKDKQIRKEWNKNMNRNK